MLQVVSAPSSQEHDHRQHNIAYVLTLVHNLPPAETTSIFRPSLTEFLFDSGLLIAASGRRAARTSFHTANRKGAFELGKFSGG
jgi:hypothetical protein